LAVPQAQQSNIGLSVTPSEAESEKAVMKVTTEKGTTQQQQMTAKLTQ